jgi:hypothetical protein
MRMVKSFNSAVSKWLERVAVFRALL